MTKHEFINRVLLIMNEAGMIDKQGEYFIGADEVQVDRHISGSYVDAWRRCVKVMPRSWFANKSFKNNTHVADYAHGIGYVVLPDDFYLLSSFKMQNWQKSVNEANVENDRVGNIQSNEWTRGSEIRPVCVIALEEVGGEVKNVLHYYSVQNGLTQHVIEKALYVPVVRPMNEMNLDDELHLSDQVIEPIAYLSASTVFTMFEKYDISKALELRAVEMFPGLQTTKSGVVSTKQ